ncbi:DUF5906 domain-containing protein [Stenotrophomonas forensis]|uniref:DNA primase family protein n=1 Tax=Stenotrophomonas forensis TaxID=2871169 RepID=UPI0036D68BE3
MNDTTPTSGVNGRPSNVLSFRGNAAPKAAFGAPAPKATLSDQAFEADFADHLKATEEYAIGGKLPDGDDDCSFFRWLPEQGYWDRCSEKDMAAKALSWLRLERKDKANAGHATSCINTAVLELMGDRKCWLPKKSDRRAIVPLKGGYLEIVKPDEPRCARAAADGEEVVDQDVFSATYGQSLGPRQALLFQNDETPSRTRIRVLAATKEHGITYQVPATLRMDQVDGDGYYTPKPLDPNSKFGQYLDLFQPDLEVRALLQEAVASSLMSICFEKAFFLVGSGSNGKSTFLHILRALHPRNVSLRLEKLDGTFAMAPLVGKSAYIVTETPKVLAASIQEVLKALISRDPIQVEAKRKDAYTTLPIGTLFASVNSWFTVSGHEHGFWRKVLAIPFNVRMGEKTHEGAKGGDGKKREPDFHLQITESEEEMAQVLDWVLEGALRLMERGGFSEKLPDAVLALAEQNRMESDTTMAYMADRDASYDSGVCTDKTAIYADYRQYVLEELGKKPVNAEDFWKRVREKFPEAGIYQISHGGKKPRVAEIRIAGIKPLRDMADLEAPL